MLLQVILNLEDQAQRSNLSGSASSFGEFIVSIMEGVLAVGAILVLLYLVWGGIEWITAGGESGKVQKARDKITQAVIGLIVLASAWALFILMQNFLGINVLDPNGTSQAAGGSLVTNSSSANTCARGVAIGETADDGGVGGYCSGGGDAIVRCVAADNHLSYPHFDPCDCQSGEPVAGYQFVSCSGGSSGRWPFNN